MYEVRVFPDECLFCVDSVKLESEAEALSVASLIDRITMDSLHIEVVDSATCEPVRIIN